jgi:UDP-3-O-[3-hydroxymyristoyl] N-acetylglucosamine deacetylase
MYSLSSNLASRVTHAPSKGDYSRNHRPNARANGGRCATGDDNAPIGEVFFQSTSSPTRVRQRALAAVALLQREMPAMIKQNTITNAVTVAGVGVHSGEDVSIRIKPAPADSGIRFVRTDLPGQPVLLARPEAVHSTTQATVLGGDGFTIATIEHCLAALAGFAIDNAVVEVDGPELPIGDGSAQVYVDALERAGSEEQPMARKYMVITDRVMYGDDKAFAAIEPYQGFRISCSIAFSHRLIGDQSLTLDVDPQSFRRDIGPARTFGFLKDKERVLALGIARGASLDNTVVLDEAGVLNAGGLRYPDEFVRHKMLDALGDLAVLGRPVRGHLETRCSGHEVMQGLVKKIAETASCYRCESFESLPGAGH